MAETCIVCLGDLALHDGGNTSATESTLVVNSLEGDHGADIARHPTQVPVLASPALAATPSEDGLIAHLLPCGHDLHDECLKPWVERANSCPICRASFNMVELRVRVGGPMTSSYAVQDKQQVADIDPSMIVDDEFLLEDDGSYDACMVCDEFGDSSQLMYCHSCEQLCHVFCAGLDRMPTRGAWYCQGCVENPELLRTASERGTPRSPAAFVNGRSRLPRRAGAPDEWVGVWQSVWDRLHFDIEFPFDDDEQSEQTGRSDITRREHDDMERRFALARQMGAGNRFRAAADNVHVRHPPGSRSRPANRVLHRETPKTPKDPESQEELRAWNQFEKAREQVARMDGAPAATPASSTRGSRKRKSIDSSPAEPEAQPAEPERKLKRPRARLHQDGGESSTTAARRNTIQGNEPSPPTDVKNDAKEGSGSTAATGFLQSLLKEVEVDRYAEREREIIAPQPRRVIVERACSPQNSSPGLSPVYSTPLGIATPPPLTIHPSRSPGPRDEAQHSPTYSPYSPADDDVRHGRHKVALRPQGLSSPPRSKDSSPTRPSLSYSTKAELQRMVTAVLKPLYIKKKLSKAQYTDVNRDVSRLLYDRVGDAGAAALADEPTRAKWQRMAEDEVDIAVKALDAKSPTAASFGDDSASSSS